MRAGVLTRNVAKRGMACRREPATGNHETPRARHQAHVAAQAWDHLGDDFVLIDEVKPPPRIARASAC